MKTTAKRIQAALIAWLVGTALTGATLATLPAAAQSTAPSAGDSPPPGHSRLTFGDTTIDITGEVGVQHIQTKPFWRLILPAGAPALSADRFDATPLADGTTAYTPKSAMPFKVQSSLGAAELNYLSLIPRAFATTISADYSGLDVAPDPVNPDDTVYSLPYRYNYPLQLTEDLVSKPLFGAATVVMKKGTTGFNAGKFSGDGVPKYLLCFFRDVGGDDTYVLPECYLDMRPAPSDAFNTTLHSTPNMTLDERPMQLARVGSASNIPIRFAATGGALLNGTKFPKLQTTDVRINHAFRLVMVSQGWTDHALRVVFRSERQDACRMELTPAADGNVHLPFDGGRELVISRVAGNDQALTARLIASDATQAPASALRRQACLP